MKNSSKICFFSSYSSSGSFDFSLINLIATSFPYFASNALKTLPKPPSPYTAFLFFSTFLISHWKTFVSSIKVLSYKAFSIASFFYYFKNYFVFCPPINEIFSLLFNLLTKKQITLFIHLHKLFINFFNFKHYFIKIIIYYL